MPHVWLDLMNESNSRAWRLMCSYDRVRAGFPAALARAGVTPRDAVAATPSDERAGAAWDVARSALKKVYDALLRIDAFARESEGGDGRRKGALAGAPPARTIEYFTEAPGYRGRREGTSEGTSARANAENAENDVDARFASIGAKIRGALYGFQIEGVRFAIERRGRVMIADQMGVGKTLQAVAVADAYRDAGPLLCVVPASMRYVWADELERWMVDLTPRGLDVILGSADKFMLEKLARATRSSGERWLGDRRVVVTSYHMLAHLREEFLAVKWGCVIADESHIMKTCAHWGREEPKMTLVARDLIKRAPYAILTTGTPSLTKPFDMFLQIDCLKPGMLGRDRWDFANHYCDMRKVDGRTTVVGGRRLFELRALLQHTVMIRRLKRDVLGELPPKCRQVVPIDIDEAIQKVGGPSIWSKIARVARAQKDEMDYGDDDVMRVVVDDDDDDGNILDDDEKDDVEYVLKQKLFALQAGNRVSVSQLVGILKVEPITRWLEHGILEDDSLQLVIFAHHQAVLDALEQVCQRIEREKKGSYVRIDGPTPAKERQMAIERFREGARLDEAGVVAVRVALLSIKASATGLDFSTASVVVFAELPDDASTLAQAEARVHRRGNENGCNVYFMCARGGRCSHDEDRWARLEQSTNLCGETLDGDVSNAGLDVDNYGANIALEGLARAPPTVVMNPPSTPDADVASTPETSAYDEQSYPLWFEVSAHSGRLHLHAAADCSKPLHESVSRAELLKAQTSEAFARVLPSPLRVPTAFAAAMSFSNAWKAMTTRERNLILDRRVACRAHELSALADALASKAASELTTSGSTTRHGRLAPLPRDAEMRRVVVARGANREQTFEMNQPFRVDAVTGKSRALCAHCAQEFGDDAVRPESVAELRFADVFCERSCMEAHTQMASAAGLRLALLKREGGVCRQCGVDCENLVRRVRALKSRAKREAEIVRLHPAFAKRGASALLRRLARTANAGHAWECDHIIAVYEGGGECTVENAQTLCVLCHAQKTKAQAKMRANERAARKRCRPSLAANHRAPLARALPESDDGSSDDARALDAELLDVPFASNACDDAKRRGDVAARPSASAFEAPPPHFAPHFALLSPTSSAVSSDPDLDLGRHSP